MATILTKKSDTASAVPLAADLTNAAGGAELAVNATDKRLFSKTSGGTVVELGTNPSSLTMPNGTANGVPYLNGSKVLTSGSAITFSGQQFAISSLGDQIKISNSVGNQLLTLSSNSAGSVFTSHDGTSFVPILWQSNTAELMRLTSTGLGIGTSSPVAKLDVQGILAVSNNSSSYWAFDRDNSSGSLTFGDTGTQRMELTTTGNLGLGVTPSAWGSDYKALQIGGSATAALSYKNFVTSLSINVYSTNANDVALENGLAAKYELNGSGQHIWKTASVSAGSNITFTQAMTLDSSGRLQVGTTSAYESARVTVSSAGSNGVSSTQASSGGYCFLSNAVSNGGTYYFHLFKANGTDTGAITSNGTTTTYATTSDYRLKTVIGAVTGHGARIDALEPIEYTWNSNGLRTRGFLAHKFQEVYADSVTGTKDAIDSEGNPQYQSMQAGSSEVIADLVAEIKALRVRVAQLESN
jgi:hypothetical protein